MAEIEPACELQNFTPKVTALSSASAALLGTALPKMLIGAWAKDGPLPQNAIKTAKSDPMVRRSLGAVALKMLGAAPQASIGVDSSRLLRPLRPVAAFSNHGIIRTILKTRG
jgi:hypothetical protein